jgi:SpoVK/Ycf46/Vps4 family AAA+-type ATPase
MCRKLTQTLKLAPDVNLEAIARSTEGLTGADLKALLYTAQLGESTTVLGSIPASGAAQWNLSGGR